MVFIRQVYMQEYNQKYYSTNKKQLNEQKQKRRDDGYGTFHGHVEAIHDPIRRYASQWHIPIDSLKKFKRWSFNDPEYEKLFKVWEESGFEKALAPVVMRRIKKRGFVLDNLFWSTKGQHAWWSGILDDIKNMSKEMEKRQTKNNPASENEQQEMINRLKAKRKSK